MAPKSRYAHTRPLFASRNDTESAHYQTLQNVFNMWDYGLLKYLNI